ncbi:MAG: hypothetical protein Kow00121_32560 [Elainellaceae cyanobacterium]
MANNWAIVVGINHYEHLSPQKHLKFAVRDAEQVKAFLCEYAGFAQDNVLLCSDNSPNMGYISTQPSRTNLLHILFEEIQKIEQADNLWFFFAGHGISKEHQDYLLPCDGRPYLEDTAVSIRFVVDRLRSSQARNIVLVLDMCRENRIEPDARRGIDVEIGSNTQEITHAQASDSQTIITIFACSPGQSSYEIAELEHGTFTYAFLEGLKQYTVLEQLDRYLQKKVPEINRNHRKQYPQIPLIVTEPGWKYNLPLLPDCATAADIDRLVVLADQAELEREFERAKSLWETVIEASSSREQRRRALEAIRRIDRNLQSPLTSPPVSSFPIVPSPDALPESALPTEPIVSPNRTEETPVRGRAEKQLAEASKRGSIERRPRNWQPIAKVGAGMVALLLGGFALSNLLSSSPPIANSLPDNYFSRGDNFILDQDPPARCTLTSIRSAFSYKQQGVEAFRQAVTSDQAALGLARYQEAQSHFQEAVDLFGQGSAENEARIQKDTTCPGGDPETVIYLNNTRALTSGKPIVTIAASVPGGTAENRALAASMLRGVAQVQNQVNRVGGIQRGNQSYMLQVLIVRDDGGSSGGQPSPENVRRVAELLVNNQIPGDDTFQDESGGGIIGVIGHYSSDATLTAGTIYDGELPAISPTSTAVRTSAPNSSSQFSYEFDLSDWVFRTTATDQILAESLVRLPFEQAAQRALIIHDSRSVYSQSFARSFERAFQAQGTGAVVGRCDLSTEDCSDEVPPALSRLQANILILAPTVAGIDEIINTINQLDNSQRQAIRILGGSALYNEDLLEGLGEKAIGIPLGVPWHRDQDQTGDRLSIFTALWGTRFIDWFTALSYDATQALIEGITEAETLTRQGLYETLNQPDFAAEGVTGIVRFDDQHDRLVSNSSDRAVGVVVEVKNQCRPTDEIRLYFCLP